MMSFELSVTVSGPGTDPRHRSHWGFLIHRRGDDFGDLLHTKVLYLERLWYQFEEQTCVPLYNQQTEGRMKITTLTDTQRLAAKKAISSEPPPRDGKKRCQDWVLDAMISLEAEELVEAGTSERIAQLVGKPAKEVAAVFGEDWIPAP